uniref:TPM domain-containing protein n=1 Tax=Chlorobium chlorochromatii (strain CaD3) TaxID=340177 RepID=Q3APQ3_CHLCH
MTFADFSEKKFPIKIQTMKHPEEKFLTQAERQRIEERIAAAEKRTSGEIVVKVVAESYHYPLEAMQGSLLLAIMVGIAVALLISEETMWLFFTFFGFSFFSAPHTESMWFFLAIFSVSFMVFHELLKRVSFLKRIFVRKANMREEVEEGATYSFFRRNIHHTVNRTGILIYISLFEHRVRVVADQGINEKVTQSDWDEVVTIIINGIKTGKQADAIATAVDRCANILAAHFPITTGDRNELSNKVILGRNG